MSTKTDEKKIENLDTLVAVGKSLDALSALLISQRKDVERCLIDLKVESSIYEDEIRNAIGTGRRYLNELHDQEEFGPDAGIRSEHVITRLDVRRAISLLHSWNGVFTPLCPTVMRS